MKTTKTANRIRGAKPSTRHRLSLLALVCCASFQALANPLGAQVVSGSATLTQSGSTLTVTNSPNSILNWQSFSINSGETTHFIQQGANSAVLNRVLGADPSQLLGTLSSNGRVFLVNPAGIVVGQGARIDVAGLVASTLNLSDADFLSNNYNFVPTLNAAGVLNAGSITTPEGGTVYLIAPQVENQGLITTPKGETILAAGNAVQLIDTAMPGVSVQIASSGNNAVNVGRILADSGRIGMVGALVRNSGELNAGSLVSQGGRVFLKASQEATLEAGSQIAATSATGVGGRVEVLGSQVALNGNAGIDASGANGGGAVLIGGDAHGANPDIQNAQGTFVGSDATIKADATQNGNGGKVVVWSDVQTIFAGAISAVGGVLAGDGGWAEVSGKQNLSFLGAVDVSSANGRMGTLLFDPANIEIAASGVAYSEGVNNLLANDPGQTTILTPASLDAVAGNIVLQASNNVTFTDSVVLNTVGASLTAEAGNGIFVNNSISTSNGNVSLTGNAITFTAAGDITAGTGTVNLASTGGDALTSIVAGTAISGADINIKTDNLGLVGTLSATNAATITRFNDNVEVQVGGAGSDGAGVLNVNSAEITNITAGIYRFGDTTSTGGLRVEGAVSVPATKTLSLLTSNVGGSQIVQNPGATITADNLRAEGGSGVTLNESNAVANLSGKTLSGDFRFTNNAALNLSTVDGQAGINAGPTSVWLTGISLSQSANAIITAASLNANATSGSVILTEANPVGVISGATTAGDFVYNTINQLTVSNVAGVNGISVPTANNIRLSSAVGINQNAGSVIKANGGNGGGLALSTAGSVFLDQTNDVGTIAASLTGAGSDFLFANSEDNVNTFGDLVVGSVSAGALPAVTGITTNGGDINLDTPGLLTVLNPISAGAGRVGLFADGLLLSNTVTSTSEVGISPYSPNTTITVGAAACGAGCLGVANLWQVNAPTIGIGEDGVLGSGGGTNPLAGAISVAGITTGGATVTDRHANTTRIGLFSGADITQTGIINVQDLGVSAGGSVTLTGANMVSNLAGKTATGPFQFTNAQTFNIAVLAGGSGFSAYSMPGIQALSGDVLLTANGATSDIVANSPQNYASVTATNGNVSLSAGRDVLIGNSGGTFADIFAYGAAKNVSITAARNILVDNFSFILSEAGDVSLTATGGNVSIRSSVNGSGSWIGAGTAGTGGIVAITAPAGSVLAPAPGYGGDVGGGHISTGSGGELVVTAYSGITLNGLNSVAGFSASNGLAGDVVLSNTSSPLTILNILNPSGAVSVTNLGAITVGANGISAGGAVALTAGSAGSTAASDIITINGPVTGSSVTLAANSVTGTIPAGATLLIPPTIDQCVADPNIAGCTAVLPSLADCTLNPALAGCIAVLPPLADCTLNPALAGCIAVLPPLADCTLNPALAGCTAVLPPLADCTLNPTLAGCTAVLPPLADCTLNPTLAGCTAVLPPLADCTLNPALPGCTAVLPLLADCTLNPSLAGCTAVLPPLADCTLNPTLAGCTAVLPPLADCTLNPALAGCTAVLPPLADCTLNPTLAGCTAVLPPLADCTLNPALAGCSAVLPTLATCTTTPNLAGCSAVLPSLAACTTTPTLAGCSAVLPTLATCTTTPTLAGCSTVLPPLVVCMSNPTAAGCSVVLPPLADCTLNPALAGCTAVLPTVATCIQTPNAQGCTAVLPVVTACLATPTLPGCAAVQVVVAACTATPTLPGCALVLPVAVAPVQSVIQQQTSNVLNSTTAASNPDSGISPNTLPVVNVPVPTNLPVGGTLPGTQGPVTFGPQGGGTGGGVGQFAGPTSGSAGTSGGSGGQTTGNGQNGQENNGNNSSTPTNEDEQDDDATPPAAAPAPAAC